MKGHKKGFTLFELILTAGVGILVTAGVLMTIIRSMILDEYNAEFSVALNVARSQLEEIFSNRENFDTIVQVESQALTMAQDGLNGAYRVEVREVLAGQLKDVKVLVCWQGRGRVWGPHCACNNGSCQFMVNNCDVDLGNYLCKGQVELNTSIAKR